MNLDEHIRTCILEEDHLADALIGQEPYAQKIRAELRRLVDSGDVALYTYDPDSSLRFFTKSESLSIMDNVENWAWQSPSGATQTFFLCRGRSDSGQP
jgi:hypothetical protein